MRVLIADDQPIIRTGLRMMLEAQPDIEVVGEAVDGRTAVRLAGDLRPDVCLFDIRMPEMDGLEATRRLAGPGVPDPLAIVVITTFDSLVVPPDSSAAAEIAAALPNSHVLKAFNANFAANLVSGKVGDQPTTVLIAGDAPSGAAERFTWDACAARCLAAYAELV